MPTAAKTDIRPAKINTTWWDRLQTASGLEVEICYDHPILNKNGVIIVKQTEIIELEGGIKEKTTKLQYVKATDPRYRQGFRNYYKGGADHTHFVYHRPNNRKADILVVTRGGSADGCAYYYSCYFDGLLHREFGPAKVTRDQSGHTNLDYRFRGKPASAGGFKATSLVFDEHGECTETILENSDSSKWECRKAGSVLSRMTIPNAMKLRARPLEP